MLVPSRRNWTEDVSACQALVNAGAIDAASRVAVAAEKRRTAVEVANCFVRIKEIESFANVEQKRLGELGATERCRISETERSKRSDRMAGVAEVSVKEGARTQREAVKAWQHVSNHATTVHAHVAEAQLRHSWLNFSAWYKFVGACCTVKLLSVFLRSKRLARHWKRNLLVFLLSALATKRALTSCVVWLHDRMSNWSTMMTKMRMVRTIISTARSGGCSAVRSIRDSLAPALASSPVVAPETISHQEFPVGHAASTSAGRCCQGVSEPLPEQLPEDAASSADPAASDEDEVQLTLQDYLEPWGLSMYAQALEEQGFDVEVLPMQEAMEREDMLRLIGCKPGHRVRFRLLSEGRLPPSPAVAS
mmetsp:Transcript_168061/g.539683  ORF Transcript_168061/g.539683 Transcript_168061/m.539683 type:complete len:364 (+) Transcript_168061:70-1161(+)